MGQETPAQFQILQAIATGSDAASDIAKVTGLSLPYILNQLALLEARGQITKEIAHKQSGPGKPKKRYKLASAMASVSILQEGFGKQFDISEPSKMLAAYFQLLSKVRDKNKAAFSEYYWCKIEYFEKIRAAAFISEQDNTIEILALTETKFLDELRKNISMYIVRQKEYKGLRLACWVHTTEEIIHGVKNHDDYYINLVKKGKIIGRSIWRTGRAS